MNFSILAQLPVSMQVRGEKNPNIHCFCLAGQNALTSKNCSMEIFEFSAWLNVSVLALVTAFQVALISGAPLGEYAFGGQNKGVLPRNLRIGSVITSFLYLGIAGHYLAQLGVFSKLLSPELNQAANWVIVGLNGLALIMNTITPSKKERMIWAPVALVLVSTSIVIALNF